VTAVVVLTDIHPSLLRMLDARGNEAAYPLWGVCAALLVHGAIAACALLLSLSAPVPAPTPLLSYVMDVESLGAIGEPAAGSGREATASAAAAIPTPPSKPASAPAAVTPPAKRPAVIPAPKPVAKAAKPAAPPEISAAAPSPARPKSAETEAPPIPAKQRAVAANDTTAGSGARTGSADATAPAQPNAGAGAGHVDGAVGGRGNGGSGDTIGGRGRAAADYRALLIASLERHKRYPSRARALGMEAEVLLRIEIDRSGRVTKRTLERPSPYSLLNSAVEEMVDRASPLPAPPASLPGERLDIVLPVTFKLT
jgi:protein TonB